MKFRDRILFFSFGICLGIIFVTFLFKGKMRKGVSDYFSGQDRIINFLINKTNVDCQIQDFLDLEDKDSTFIRGMIINADIEIISRDSCFEYLLIPDKNYCLQQLLIKKCDQKVSLVHLEIKD